MLDHGRIVERGTHGSLLAARAVCADVGTAAGAAGRGAGVAAAGDCEVEVAGQPQLFTVSPRVVIPAQAGIQVGMPAGTACVLTVQRNWVPACAGTTVLGLTNELRQ